MELLEDGAYDCYSCNGKGGFIRTITWRHKHGKVEIWKASDNHMDPYFVTCSTCLGSGWLDWIENVKGKKGKM